MWYQSAWVVHLVYKNANGLWLDLIICWFAFKVSDKLSNWIFFADSSNIAVIIIMTLYCTWQIESGTENKFQVFKI